MSDVTEQIVVVERYHPRIEPTFMVKLLVNGRRILAKAKDLSMAGLCLLSAPGVADEVQVELPLPNDREIVTKATVKRRAQGSLALEFAELDWDDMLALARYLHPRLP